MIKIRPDITFFLSHYLFLAVICSNPSFCQSGYDNIADYNSNIYIEELFVQTDRDFYVAGEKIYFKVFCFNSLTHKPSSSSRVAYVTLLDDHNDPVAQVKISLDGFSGHGQLVLPETTSSGNYYLCSCTRWMQNFSQELFSYKNVAVVNPFENLERNKIPVREPDPDTIIFYPEYGNIINGQENLIGFRSLDKDKKPVEIKGYIINGKDTICGVHSDYYGYGFFSLKPESHESLYLITEGNSYLKKKFSLASIPRPDIAFSIETPDAEKDPFMIGIFKNNPHATYSKRYFLTCNPFSMSSFTKEFDPEMEPRIPLGKNTLPAGLSEIKVSDIQGNTISRRFIYNELPSINCRIDAGKTEYKPREKVRIVISASDNSGKPVSANLAVSVVKSFLAGRKNTGNIAGLPGPAAIYCGNEIRSINDRLIFYSPGDIFTTDGMRTGSGDYLPEPECHIISGKIYNTASGESLKNENIVLSMVGKTSVCRFTRSDSDGRFSFKVCEKGELEVVIDALNRDVADYYIETDNPFPDVFTKFRTEPLYIDTGQLGDINKAIIAMQIHDLYEPDFIPPVTKVKVGVDRNFYGKPDIQLQLSSYIELTSVKEIFKELVPGVITYSDNDKSRMSIYQYPDRTAYSDPFVLLDGVPVHDHDAVLKLNPGELEQIRVVYSRYFIRDMVFEGIVDFTTRQGKLNSAGITTPAFRQEYQSLQPEQKFRSPLYSTAGQKESRIPDFRNTLYWDPEVKTNSQGEAYIEFYTSDETGSFKIIVEGFTSEGLKGSAESVITVSEDNKKVVRRQ